MITLGSMTAVLLYILGFVSGFLCAVYGDKKIDQNAKKHRIPKHGHNFKG